MSEPVDPGGTRAVPRRWRTTGVRIAVAVAVLVVLVVVVRAEGPGLRQEIGRVSPAAVVAAVMLGLLGVWFSLLSWRAALASVGAQLPLLACVRVFLPSQIGKYVPGSVWPVVAQTQLAARYGITRSRMATGSLLSLGLSVIVSAAIGAILLPVLAGRGATGTLITVVLVAAVVLGGAVLHPRVLGPVLDRVLRTLHRPPVGKPDGREVTRSMLASVGAWLSFGAHAAVLAHSVGGRGVAPLIALVAFPLASSAGILVVFAPAGAGVREAVLVLLLRDRLGTEAATALVLLSRGLLAVADFVAAGVGVAAPRPGRRRSPRPAPPPDAGAPL